MARGRRGHFVDAQPYNPGHLHVAAHENNYSAHMDKISSGARIAGRARRFPPP